eukprot:227587_1
MVCYSLKSMIQHYKMFNQVLYADEQMQQLKYMVITCSVISLIGWIIIFVACIYCIKLRLRESESKLLVIHLFIISVAFSDLIRTVGNLIDADYPYSTTFHSCTTQAIFKTFGGISSFILVSMISMIMYIAISMDIKQQYTISNKISKYKYHALLFVIVVSSLFSFSPINKWCNPKYHDLLRLTCFYIPLTAMLFVIMCCYLRIGFLFRSKPEMHNNKKFLQIYNNIKYFPMVLLFCWLFGAIRRTYNIVTLGQEPPFIIACIHVITMSLYGFFNCITYCNVIKNHIKSRYTASPQIQDDNQQVQEEGSHQTDDSEL